MPLEFAFAIVKGTLLSVPPAETKNQTVEIKTGTVESGALTLLEVLRMNRFLVKLVFMAAATSLLHSSSTAVQVDAYRAKELPPAKRAARVQITQGPALERAGSNWAIIRWTSNNPGGTDEHFAVANYSTNPKNLSEIAKSHIRLNRSHPYTVFRVRIDGLKPQTTYYYTVDSMEGNGTRDGVNSPVKHFTTRR